MAGTALCVIDMQPGFAGSQKIIDETIREIRLAKRRKDPIVFLELMPGSQKNTDHRLMEAAYSGGYSNIAVTTKTSGDGSRKGIEVACMATCDSHPGASNAWHDTHEGWYTHLAKAGKIRLIK